MRSLLAMLALIVVASGCQQAPVKQLTSSLDQARASYEQALVEQATQTNGQLQMSNNVLTEIRDLLQAKATPEPAKSVEPLAFKVPEFRSPPPPPPPPPAISEARVIELINQRLAAFKPVQQAVYQPSTQAPRSTVVQYQSPQVRIQAACSGGVCATPTSYVKPRLIWRRR